ncbi:oxygenase [Sphingomonas oleivorans]|uniref:Oxygenase n=1 Tax=Sphingomonas oleivorans TaxID=1735121 RepID=A0A2T5FVP0_9SPHN|nr:2OG-Fe(II) oxygenase [Sphingomonas oleivorans]PTQ09843.1 oxygenase [Sphingomonas oleivorans]
MNGTAMERSAAFAGAQRLPSSKLELFIRRDFLTPDECAGLIDAIDAGRRPSLIADDQGDALFRTSETCDLDPAAPLIATIDARIAAFAGLDPLHGEPMQGQRYAVGQEFKLHTDYFEPTGLDYARFCAETGQRTWTVMIYLNQPDAGGATRFKVPDKIVQPETGKLLCWNNLLPDGRPNPATLHQGMKVRRGVKYIVTKWYRERPRPK